MNQGKSGKQYKPIKIHPKPNNPRSNNSQKNSPAAKKKMKTRNEKHRRVIWKGREKWARDLKKKREEKGVRWSSGLSSSRGLPDLGRNKTKTQTLPCLVLSFESENNEWSLPRTPPPASNLVFNHFLIIIAFGSRLLKARFY